MRSLYRFIAGVVSVATMGIMSVALYLQVTLPDMYSVAPGEALNIISPFNIESDTSGKIPLSAYGTSGNSYKTELTLMGLVDIKEVGVQIVDRQLVVPCGSPFGIKMFTDGVMVVGAGDIQLEGETKNPAAEAGISVGDIIVEMKGKKVYTNNDVSDMIKHSNGDPIDVKLRRGSKELNCELVPIKSPEDHSYKAGIWVRDSSAGIGTMTFYNPTSSTFAGLGHAICDVDTDEIMPLYRGQIVRASVTGVTAGRSGSPGELKGMFVRQQPLGSLEINSATGVYGILYDKPIIANPVPLAYKHEVRKGPATILTTVDGERPKEYSIIIDEINYSDSNPTKNMVIRITDPSLLQVTGGIVQGMSGSPIIQNGYLVGAVTHVFVNDPTSGYGIFAENMEDSINCVEIPSNLAS